MPNSGSPSAPEPASDTESASELESAPAITHSSQPDDDLCVGEALWRHREVLSACCPQARRLSALIAKEDNLPLYQWLQLMALALEYQPDLIVELGRYKGNSTCAFNQVAHAVVTDSFPIESICITDAWAGTRRRLKAEVDDAWFEPIHIHTRDILAVDFERLLGSSRRVLVFWDAHGMDVAGCVLGKLLPMLKDRSHLVAMHDVADVRFSESRATRYDGQPLWSGESATDSRVQLGHLSSNVAQAVAIYDFASRNGLELHTADEQLHQAFSDDEERRKTLTKLLGEDGFSLSGGWIWFSLNEATREPTFPEFRSRPLLSWAQRVKVIINVLRHGIVP